MLYFPIVDILCSHLAHENISNWIHIEYDLFEPKLVDLMNDDEKMLLVAGVFYLLLNS